MAVRNRKRKDKLVAAVLAFFAGSFGLHRFYLGQIGLGVLYLCFFFISWIPAFIDAISFLVMDDEDFDFKYNRYTVIDNYKTERFDDFDARRAEERRRNSKFEKQKERERNLGRQKVAKNNPHKIKGIEKYKDFDFYGAITEFKKALQVDYQDVAVHFNLSCAYSINEDKESAFFHLDKAVEYGFVDFDKIKNHDALAFLRIQPEYESFINKGFRLSVPTSNLKVTPTVKPVVENKSNNSDSLLDQLKKLGDLRERGLLTEEEFSIQKEKLLRS